MVHRRVMVTRRLQNHHLAHLIKTNRWWMWIGLVIGKERDLRLLVLTLLLQDLHMDMPSIILRRGDGITHLIGKKLKLTIMRIDLRVVMPIRLEGHIATDTQQVTVEDIRVEALDT